jgi:hypothetical protein
MKNDKQTKHAGKSANENLRPLCSLCGKIYRDYGHNAWPLNEGRCCDDCNNTKVLPERIARLHQGRKK